jgi:AAA15 family ATPase/GTPase
MLLQFTVKNYKSFRDEAVLSLEASNDKEHENNIIDDGKDRVLKTVSIFGANAAGKTSLFNALTAAILTIKTSNTRQLGEPIVFIEPYAFRPNAYDEPTEFEFVFKVDGKKYVYGFSATVKKIITEYLYVYNTARATTIFERDETDSEVYKFTVPKIKTELSPLVDRNTENKLFLATATAWNSESTRQAAMWLLNMINTYDTKYENILPLTYAMFENDVDNSMKRFTNNILREADINIADFKYESKDVPVTITDGNNHPMPMMPDDMPRPFHKVYKIDAMHNVKDENGNDNSYYLPMVKESRGTQSLFFMSPILKRAFESGETVCIDEFDSSLHPLLVDYLVGLFNNKEINKKDAQLIVSSHTMSLLNLKLLRRDQIYFVEKNQKNACSELFSLDEFSPRKSEDIRKAYLQGRYGSIPDIMEGANLWE